MPAGARRRRLVLRTPPAPRFLGAPPDRSRRPGRPRWSRTRRSSACRSGGPLPKRRPVSVAVENGLNDLGQPQLGYRRTVGLWRTGPKCGARGALHWYQTTSTILGYLRTPKLHSSSGSAEAACAGGQSSATNCGHFRSKPVRKPVFLVTNIRSAGAAVDVLDPHFRFTGPTWIDPSDSRQLVPEYTGKQCDWKPQPHSAVRPMRRHVNLRYEPRMTSAKLLLRAELIFARAPVSS